MDNHHSDPPAPDPIKDLVASFNQSLFVRASNLAGAAKMTSNSSLPDPPKPTKPPTQSLISNQRPLPSVPSMSSTVGQSQSTSSPSRALPPRSEPQSSIFGQPRSLESTPLPSDLSQSNTMGQSQSTLFPSWALPVRPEPHSSNFVQPKFLESVPNASTSSVSTSGPVIKAEYTGKLQSDSSLLVGSLPSSRPLQILNAPRAQPLASYPTGETDPKTQEFLRLLHGSEDFNFAMSPENEARLQEIKTTPLFSNQVRLALTPELMTQLGSLEPSAFPQYGLLGVRQQSYGGQRSDAGVLPIQENLIMANMNAPWSTFICGSQGGGKSHTLSCLLETSLLTSSPGENPKPLAGLVFHYDHFTSAESTQLCEAAYLCSAGVPVRVLVSPSNYPTMHRLYNNLPGLPDGSPKPQVMPLYIKEEHLSVNRMMTLMLMNDISEPPLYMEVLYQILRDMAREGNGSPGLDYTDFISRLSQQGFSSQQKGPLNLRLQLLEAFLADRVQTQESSALLDDVFKSAQGTLTIVDLSCPFVNENDACALFTICLSIFVEHRADCGRIVAIDEAHKFLTKTGEAKRLTEQLISLIRQQRHLGTRVVISTQEPTISTQLLDLCNVCIVHRFNSPAWFHVLKTHLAGAKSSRDESDIDPQQLFEKIVALRTGEAFIFCPTALLDVRDGEVCRLQNGFIRIKIRPRCSADGGRSIMAGDDQFFTSNDSQPVSNTIRPYKRQETARYPSARATTDRVSSAIGQRTALAPAPEPAPAPATARPNTAYATAPPVQPKPKPDTRQINQALREAVVSCLLADPGRLPHQDIRKRVVAQLNLPRDFFTSAGWLKMSRITIWTEALKHTQARGLPPPINHG